MPDSGETTRTGKLCGKWMPVSRDYCGRGPNHGGDCRSRKAMESQRRAQRAKERPYDPVAVRRWSATYRVARYGLTSETFARKLAEQGNACGMCLEPFKDGQRVCIDHDHACCPEEKRSCGRCVRGLLCVQCNVALGFIESKYAQASQYLGKWQLP